MIKMESELPIAGRPDIWQSEINVKNLTPARRDKLVTLLNLAGFILRDINSKPVEVGEIVDNGEASGFEDCPTQVH